VIEDVAEDDAIMAGAYVIQLFAGEVAQINVVQRPRQPLRGSRFQL
jgi:hypothetical protein